MAKALPAQATEPTTETAPEATTPDVFDAAIAARQQAEAVVQQVAESTRLPDAEREAAHTNGHAHQHAPANENGHAHRHHHREPGQSHAEAVGKRPRYTGQGKTDFVICAQLDEHQNPYLSVIRFKEKPSEPVREFMKQSGFTWRQENEEWTKPIHFDTRVQDRMYADRTFEEACKMIRTEHGINHGYGGPSAA
jgi:hypothetical protein